MKKLLTLILPALVLTAAPKQATGDAASYHYRADAKRHLAIYHRADADAKRRLTAAAGADAKRRLTAATGDAASYYYRAAAKYRQGDYDGVIADYQRAAESQADDAASYYYRAKAKEMLDDDAGAMADLRRAAESKIDDAAPQQAASPAPVEATGQATAGTADGASGERYGAFAIDEGAWAYGFSLLAPSRDEANRAALARCVQEGGDECEISYVFNGSRCGAAAVAEERGLRAWGYGHAESRYEAVDTALGFCERDNTSGGECRLVSVACGE